MTQVLLLPVLTLFGIVKYIIYNNNVQLKNSTPFVWNKWCNQLVGIFVVRPFRFFLVLVTTKPNNTLDVLTDSRSFWFVF